MVLRLLILLLPLALLACAPFAHAFPAVLPTPDLSALDFRNGADPVPATSLSVIGLGPSGAAYVSGPFTSVGGQNRPHGIVRVNAAGGVDNAWSPTLPVSQPFAAAVENAAGTVVLVAALQNGQRSGVLIPAASATGSVFATWSFQFTLTLDSTGAIYAAVASGADVAVLKYGPSGAPEPSFELTLSGLFYPCTFPGWVNRTSVSELRVIDGFLYAGGDFTSLGNARGSAGIRGAARASAATGDVDTGWAPLATTPYFGAAGSEEKLTCAVGHAGATSIRDGPDNTVYMAGPFTLASGFRYLARFSKSAPGSPDASWNPPLPRGAAGVATDPTGNFVYVTGSFPDIAGQNRSGIAAFLASTGELHAWDPGASSTSSVVALADRVILSGFFSSVHGVARHRLAAVARPDSASPGPMITLAPRPLAFGEVQLGTLATRDLAVANPGSGPLTIQGITVGTYSASTTANVTHDCSPNVPAGGGCTIRFEAGTTDMQTPLAPQLTVTSDGGGTPQVVQSTWDLVWPILTIPGKAAWEGGWFMRSPVGYTRTETVRVRNAGRAPMEITSIATAAPLTQSNDCPAILAPRAECQLTVSFTPQQSGSATGQVTFTFAKLTAATSSSFVTTAATSHDVTIGLNGDTESGDSDGDGMPNGVEIAEGRDPVVKDNDIFGVNRYFVMQQYRDFLGREGDAGGIAYWTQQLDSGAVTRPMMALAFLTSGEFQDTVAPVARLYFAYFLRIPDYAGLNYWMAQYRGGQTIEQISAAFAASPEFASRYGAPDNGQFVVLVYQNVLGRAPDPAGRDYWTNRLASGSITRGELMVAFSESPEYRSLITSEILVTMSYMGMLRRAPDPGGFSYWVNYVDQGNTPLALASAFVGAPEYRRRFLP